MQEAIKLFVGAAQQNMQGPRKTPFAVHKPEMFISVDFEVRPVN